MESKLKGIDEFMLISFCDSFPVQIKDNPRHMRRPSLRFRQGTTILYVEQNRIRRQKYQQPQNFRDRSTTSKYNRIEIRDRNTCVINSRHRNRHNKDKFTPPKSYIYCNEVGHNKDEC
ncbi:LOW QUALITY PROTEIN: uncharacterized protein V1478_004450 [Vespula squamosa]|uniref:Uncharacterized protein n=1 Tax=Vespula squamosa TaxID=30214 RepID=A0ABD2BG79_VESSQ